MLDAATAQSSPPVASLGPSRHMLLGDTAEVLAGMPDKSVHSVVTDPPYGLSDHKRIDVAECLMAWCQGKEYRPRKRGLFGHAWDAWVPGPEVWRECLRVLKPGGYLLCFAGTRSMDLMSIALRLAGFELRDAVGNAHDAAPLMAWCYAEGFPKSSDLGSAIMKAAANGRIAADADPHALASRWDGWSTNLKPAWEPIIVARKPLEGSVAENITAHGVGALNIDGCRVPASGESFRRPAVYSGEHEGWNRPWKADQSSLDARQVRKDISAQKAETLGRWPANLIHDGSDAVRAEFPSTDDGINASRFFYAAKANSQDRDEGLDAFFWRRDASAPLGAVRVAKEEWERLPTSQRCRGNMHSAVKPTALMRYLVRLVTPVGGTCLDIFAGSGSTGKATVFEEMSFIGIDSLKDCCDMATARIAFAEAMASIPTSDTR